MFCLLDYEKEISQRLQQKVIFVEDPALFGRTFEEKSKYENSLLEKKPEKNIKDMKEISTPTVHMENREVMKMENLLTSVLNFDSAPVTLDVAATEDFQLSFRMPGDTPDKVQAIIYEQMKEFFVDSARFILQSKRYGRYIKDPGTNAPFNPFQNIGG